MTNTCVSGYGGSDDLDYYGWISVDYSDLNIQSGGSRGCEKLMERGREAYRSVCTKCASCCGACQRTRYPLLLEVVNYCLRKFDGPCLGRTHCGLGGLR